MGPGDLSRVLAPLPAERDPRILVGRETFDDAGVYRISDEIALVQTLDFFAPIVDDPWSFGRIAAANAMSDVYAMGGEVLTALAIAAFPTGALPLDVLTSILLGAQDAVHEAGGHVIGGHTIVDEELKFGLAVTGRAHPDALLTNAAARAGDALVLTKPIGTGILATAMKQGTLQEAHADVMIESMSALNAPASRAALALGVRCATDITGFGLLGHALHIARASQATLRIDVGAVPVLPGAREAWLSGARTGGAERNDAYLSPLVRWGQVSNVDRAVLIDPQTSGGLLVAVPLARLPEYLSRVAGSVVVGAVEPQRDNPLVLA